MVMMMMMALGGSYQDFTFRVKGNPHVMPNGSVRAAVVLHCRRLAADVDLPTSTLKEAEQEARAFIAAIAAETTQ